MRWGIIGTGNIANDFVSAFRFLDRKTLSLMFQKPYAVASRSLERAQSFAAKHGIGTAYGDYKQLLTDEHVDIVYVGLINSCHKSVVLDALRSGKHVLCENPIGVNVGEFREMKEAAKRDDKFLMEGIWSAFFPVYRRLKAEIDSGELGTPKFLNANFSFKHTGGEASLDAGGGTLMSIGYYLPWLAYFIFGDYPSTITATGIVPEGLPDKTVGIQLKFPGGGLANLECTSDVEKPSSVEVFGTKNTLVIPDHMWCPDKLLSRHKGLLLHEPLQDLGSTFPHAAGFSYEILHVERCIQEGLVESPIIPWSTTEAVLGMTDEIRKQIGVVFPMDS